MDFLQETFARLSTRNLSRGALDDPPLRHNRNVPRSNPDRSQHQRTNLFLERLYCLRVVRSLHLGHDRDCLGAVFTIDRSEGNDSSRINSRHTVYDALDVLGENVLPAHDHNIFKATDNVELAIAHEPIIAR